jgi:hypothetical protein
MPPRLAAPRPVPDRVHEPDRDGNNGTSLGILEGSGCVEVMTQGRRFKIDRRPFIGLPQEHSARTGFFERVAFDAGLTQLPDDLKVMFAVASFTRWRVKSEILTRQRAHVDFQSGWRRLERCETKNAEGRQFPHDHLARRAGEPARAHARRGKSH